MLPRLGVFNQRKTAIKSIVLCCGCGCLSFLAIIGFDFLPRFQAADNIFLDRRASTAPTKTPPEMATSYSKLPLSLEPTQGQTPVGHKTN